MFFNTNISKKYKTSKVARFVFKIATNTKSDSKELFIYVN